MPKKAKKKKPKKKKAKMTSQKSDLEKISHELVERVNWFWGFDGEYNFSASIYEDHILWYLEFDEQWTDPPQEAIQSLDDFLKNGPPRSFDSNCDSKEIRKIVLRAKKQAKAKAANAKKANVSKN